MEPEEVDVVEVLNRKGEPILGASFERAQFIPPGKTSDPWLPFLILIPLSIKDSFRTLFKEETKDPGCETRIIDGIGSRHAIALYGPPPKLRALPPPPAPEPPAQNVGPAPALEP